MPVTIYEHANYQGRSQELTEGQYDNAMAQLSIGNDTLSSLKVSPGLVVRLYEDWLFRGQFIDIKTDTPDLALPWQDRASSIVVYKDGQPPAIKPYAPVMGINTFEPGGGVGPGVYGESKTWMGVYGVTFAPWGGGVVGISEVHNPDPIGQPGKNAGPGVLGKSDGVGVWGASETWVGVFGETKGNGGMGVLGQAHNGGHGVVGDSPSGIGIIGKGKLAGRFEGDVEVTGDIRLANADCAEDFNIGTASAVEPGTVMILGDEGSLLPSQQAYDKRVAGVVSGAGAFKPGIVLDKQQAEGIRQPIALLGKVYCKADAQYGAIEIGDLLTTSPTPGHAMKAFDPSKAFGAVMGKALRPLREGHSLIPILIALQ